MKKYIDLPGMVDAHVHSRDLKQRSKMTVMQTMKEARKSGVATVCLMPNTDPSIDNEETLNEYLRLMEDAERKTGVTAYVWVALTDTNHAEVIKMLRYKKVCGVKVYPLKPTGESVTTGAVGIQQWSSIMKLLFMMREEANIDKPIAGHFEDPLLGHTEESEVSALKTLVSIAKRYPEQRFTACHITSAGGLAIIEEAWASGLKIMAELTPHHLWWNRETIKLSQHAAALFHCFPPIKEPKDQQALIQFLVKHQKNPLVSIGSDTAPHHRSEKAGDNPPGGVPALQHSIPVLLTIAQEYGIEDGHICYLIHDNVIEHLGIESVPDTMNTKWVLQPSTDAIVYNKGEVSSPWIGEKFAYTRA
ncbi:MAG: dihydroorotase family protein [Patescibacteria group bacterium]|nr:dihydroorotase family protein [Patescibacteria group bacterium]